MTKCKWLGTLLTLLATGQAEAFVDPPIIVPSNPISGQPIETDIRYGVCDSISDLPHQIELEVVGNTIRMTVDGLRRTDPLWCIFSPPITRRFPVGSYPAGNYNLEVYLRYREFFGPNIRVDLVGEAAFTVTGTPLPPQPVPSIRGFGIGALILLLLLIGRHRCVTRGSPVF